MTRGFLALPDFLVLVWYLISCNIRPSNSRALSLPGVISCCSPDAWTPAHYLIPTTIESGPTRCST